MDFSGKVVLVTGAASGIGHGIARRFAEAGASVAAFDIRPASFELSLTGDVASETDSLSAVERTVARYGRLDALINNAGIELNGTVVEMEPADWDRQIAVNLRGVYLMSRAAIPRMAGRGGSIVNISSAHAWVSWPRCPAYDATKSGLIGLTRAMALDHGREGIRVNAICPGYIDTPMLEGWLDSLPDRESAMRSILDAHPLGRIGSPRDIAEAALWLASSAASFVTGTALTVDGGMTIAGH